MRVKSEEAIRIWNRASSLSDFCRQAGCRSRGYATVWAYRMRSLGVPMRRFHEFARYRHQTESAKGVARAVLATAGRIRGPKGSKTTPLDAQGSRPAAIRGLKWGAGGLDSSLRHPAHGAQEPGPLFEVEPFLDLGEGVRR
mgnify:CR=1 FL=1